MKTILIFLSIFIISQQQYIFRSQYDGDFLNQYQGGTHGINTNGVLFTDNRLGETLKSAQFDGVDSYLLYQFYDDLDIKLSDFTIAFWIKPTQKQKIQTILQHGAYDNTSGFYVQTTEVNKLKVLIQNADKSLYISVASVDVLPLHTWTLAYIVVDRKQGIEIFFNGKTVGSIEKKFDITDLQNGLGMTVGCNQNLFTECFKGEIDDLRIFNELVVQSTMIQEIDICDESCKSCIGQLDTCNSCETGMILTNSNQCLDNSDQTQCSNQCQTCETHVDNCITCKLEDFRKDNPPYCSCQDGYFEDLLTFNCEQCPDECTTCDSNGDCIEFNLTCENNEFYDEKSEQCKRCFYYDDECVNECPDDTKKNELTYLCESTIWNQTRIITLAIMFLLFVIVLVIIYFCMQSRKNTKVQVLNKDNNFNNSSVDQTSGSPLKRYSQKMGQSLANYQPTHQGSQRSIESPTRMSQRDLQAMTPQKPMDNDSETSVKMEKSRQIIELQSVQRYSKRRSQAMSRRSNFNNSIQEQQK